MSDSQYGAAMRLRKGNGSSLRQRPSLKPLVVGLAVAIASGGPFFGAAGEAAASTAHPRSQLPVTSCDDDGSAGTLRSVIASAASGDTVDLTGVTCATITLISGQITTSLASLTLQGPGQGNLTIDGSNAGRVILHTGTGTLTLDALTLAHGRADAASVSPDANAAAFGGCVYSTGTVALVDATISSCVAINAGTGSSQPQGGGILAGGATTLTRATVTGNTASSTQTNVRGGGIYARGATTITDSTVSGNQALVRGSGAFDTGSGGGLFLNGGGTVTDSVIDGNFAGCDTSQYSCQRAEGGGIAAGGTSLALTASTLSNNHASATQSVHGGGLTITFGDLHILDTTINGNQATGSSSLAQGGGVFTYIHTVDIASSTISGNSTTGAGGGLFVDYDGFGFSLANSTVSQNSAQRGGGIYLGHAGYYYSAQGISLKNSTITANVATSPAGGAGIHDTHEFNPSTFQSSIVADNIDTAAPDKADVISTNVASIGGANNLIVAAAGLTLPADTLDADPLLGPLQDNGGPTFTHALAVQSPAIDAGNNAANLPFDQRGEGFPRLFGAAADIGAFEVQQATGPAAPTLTVSFSPQTILQLNRSTLTLTLSNANNEPATLTSDLVNTLPPEIKVATPNVPQGNSTTTCPDGVVTAEYEATSFTFAAGAQIPPAGSCTVTVDVTSTDFSVEATATAVVSAGTLQTDLGSNADSATDVLSLTAAAGNNLAPVAVDDVYTIRGNTLLFVPAPGLVINDYDPDLGWWPGQCCVYNPTTLITDDTLGQAIVNMDADILFSFEYHPPQDFVGTDYVLYFNYDTNGYPSDLATVTITVTALNHVPVGVADHYTVQKNATLTVDAAQGVLANDTDADGDALTVQQIDVGTNTFLYADGSFVYMPPPDFVGTYQFTYRPVDGDIYYPADPVTVTISVQDVDSIFANGFESP